MTLLNAAALSGYSTNFNNSYSIGYSILLVPAFLCGLSPHSIFIFAIMLNATMLAGLFIILIKIMCVYTSMSMSRVVLAAILVSLYPSLWVYSNHALPEILIVFLIASAILKLKQSLDVRNRSILAWLYFSFICAVLPVAHLRYLPIPIVSILIIFLICRNRQLKSRFAITLVTLQLGVIALGFLLKLIANDNLLISGHPLNDNYINVGKMIVALLTSDPLKWVSRFVGAASGQLFYMGTATYGLALIGILKISWDILRKDNKLLYVDRLWKGFILLSFIFSLAVSAAEQTVSRLPDQFIFGRYIDPFAALFMVFAVTELFSIKVAELPPKNWTGGIGALEPAFLKKEAWYNAQHETSS